ncbi:Gfo/Idh/MocA family oxidoreductase [Haloferula sp.]|uniref:Gfo/Idh/MocA family oxidoreductase n=1 Tax=Haloferula sp. TaxID=2497595 RepID=UPI003C795FC3
MSITTSTTRRDFLKKSAVFGAFSIVPSHVVLGQRSSSGQLAPSERVNLAMVGVGNRGFANTNNVNNTGLANFVAMCDIDLQSDHAQKTLKEHPDVPQFSDWRRMFDKIGDDIDALVITTPDHAHFSVSMLAMSLGKHIYLEKPLAHTFGQCDRLMKMAEKSGVATQMGNYGHSGAAYFQFKKWQEAGIIKDVTKIDAYMNKARRWHGWGESVTAYPVEALPAGVDWDLWCDGAPVNPYSKRLHPEEWRSWYDYGCGAFGDWGPHMLDTCHRFLELGMPRKITADELVGTNRFVYPQESTIRFSFEARGEMPPCEVAWYDGQQNFPEVPEGLGTIDKVIGKRKPLNLTEYGELIYGKGPDGKDLVFLGGAHGAALRVLPQERYKELAPTLPRITGKHSDHYANFLLACKGEEETRTPFSISGPLTQLFNLGILAQRFGGELDFDEKSQQITNNKEANDLLDPAPRKGWEQYYKL